MSLHKPKSVAPSEPFQERFKEGEPFRLRGGRIVENVDTEYGKGNMVILEIETAPDNVENFTLFGQYVEAQIRDAEASDFPATMKLERGPIEGFSDRPDTKRLADAGDDIPF